MAVEKTKTHFNSVELAYEEESPLLEYNKLDISQLEEDDYYSGKPELSQVETYTYDNDGKEETKHRIHLFLIDEEEEEYLDIRINLKKPDDIQERIHHKSKLYALCCGLMELENPGVTQNMNMIKKVDINEFREFINNLSEMTIRVKTEYGNNFTYNTFIVTSCKA